MDTIESYFQFFPNIHPILNSFKKDKLSKRKASLSSIKKLEFKLNASFSKNGFSFEISRESTQINQFSLENSESQAKYYISHIEDPLWKLVCIEMADMMGPFFLHKIWDCKLGFYRSGDKTMNLYCSIGEAAQFVNQYSFLILGALQCYFPAIKTLKITVNQVL